MSRQRHLIAGEPNPELYPNLHAILSGCVSGNLSDWIAVSRELRGLCLTFANGISEEHSGGTFTLKGQGPDALDAARYRYLRNEAESNASTEGPIVCSGLGDNFEFIGGEQLDREVDEEMAALKGTK